jgi:hypothetical protein
MWPVRRRKPSVVCLACGRAVDRADAREYDKYGDRWDRDGKEFEFLCKPCYVDVRRDPRPDLERLLVDAGAGETSQATFLTSYLAALETRERRIEEES